MNHTKFPVYDIYSYNKIPPTPKFSTKSGLYQFYAKFVSANDFALNWNLVAVLKYP